MYLWTITEAADKAQIKIINKKTTDTSYFNFQVKEIPLPESISFTRDDVDTIYANRIRFNGAFFYKRLVPGRPNFEFDVVCIVCNFTIEFEEKRPILIDGNKLNNEQLTKLSNHIGKKIYIDNIKIKCPCYDEPVDIKQRLEYFVKGHESDN